MRSAWARKSAGSKSTIARCLVAIVSLASVTVGAEQDPASIRESHSPFLSRRLRAQEELAPQISAEALRSMLVDSDPMARRTAAALCLRHPDFVPAVLLVERVLVEVDSRTRRALGDALLERPATETLPLLRERIEGTGAAPGPRELYDRLVLAAVQALFESRISDGSIPGFYDGQFAELWPLDPKMAERLIQYSRDPGLHFVFRALAVMALHETRRPTLQEELAPLLLPTEVEFRIDFEAVFDPRPDGPEVVEERRRADLSKYARFSLAKAGMPRSILEMVGRMDEEIARGRALLGSRPDDPQFLDQRENFFREWLLDLLFETGYYFQQFDDYDRAAERYRSLIERYPEARACQNAHYNLACIESIRGQLESALFHLRAAVRLGFTDYEWLLEDGDLAPLRLNPAFQQIVEAARSGGGEVVGRGWMRVLTPFLPPDRAFFELPAQDQEAILKRAGDQLGAAEIDALLESAPADQRVRLRRWFGRE